MLGNLHVRFGVGGETPPAYTTMDLVLKPGLSRVFIGSKALTVVPLPVLEGAM
jgi:hypothetical protein